MAANTIGLPFFYDEINNLRGHKVPSVGLCYDSETYYFFWRSLYQRLASKFEWQVPDHWDKEVFEFSLYAFGFLGVFDTNKYARTPNQRFGIIPAPSTVHGIGVQMQPTKIRTANPHFYMPYDEIIYEGAGLIKLTSDYRGILDIVDFYARELATLWSSIDQSIINSRFAYIISANSEAAAATLKAIFDGRNSGKPLMVYDKEKLKKKDPVDKTLPLDDKEPFEVLDLRVGENYITDKLLADYRRILVQFDTEVGIPNNPFEKGERLISNEVESNSAETVARFTYMMDILKRSLKKTYEVFPELESTLTVKARTYDTGQTGAKEAGKEVADVKQIDSSRNP